MFGRLENSIRQAGKILRREFPPSRLFEIEIDDLLAENISSRRKIWAVYVADEDDSLVPRKIYEIEIYEDLPQVLIQDDDGEAFMCPGSGLFLLQFQRSYRNDWQQLCEHFRRTVRKAS